MISWSMDNFIFTYVIFSWGTVMQQEFSHNAWVAVLIVSFLLGFRLRKQ